MLHLFFVSLQYKLGRLCLDETLQFIGRNTSAVLSELYFCLWDGIKLYLLQKDTSCFPQVPGMAPWLGRAGGLLT